MAIKRNDVAKTFGVDLSDVEQIGSKQLFLIHGYSCDLIVSYCTVIGYLPAFGTNAKLTDRYYSQTTSCHRSYMIRLYKGEIIEHRKMITDLIEDYNIPKHLVYGVNPQDI